MVRKKENIKDSVSREEFVHAFRNLKRGMERLNQNQFILLEKEKNRVKLFNIDGGGAM